MGIHGLWPVLEPASQPVTLESLEGKKLAVDVSLWIYQSQSMTSETNSPHLSLMISRLCKLLFYKIRPVFVFDGLRVPIFKRRILEERRLRKLEEEMVLNKDNRKCLEELAKGNQNEEEAKRKLHSPQKRLKNRDEAIFNLPSTSAPVVEISDDDDDLAVMKVVETGVISNTPEIERLLVLREQIRVSRLHPDSIPDKTEDFCQFQLARVLGRNKINRTITKLTKEHQNQVVGADVRLVVADNRGGSHVISYEGSDEIRVIEQEQGCSKDINWDSLGLTLDHFQSANISSESRETDNDSFDINDIAELNGREEFLGKTSMIEKFMLRRIGSNRAEALQQDVWSSDSGDDDFIDVSDGEAKPTENVEKPRQNKNVNIEKEWSPGREDDNMMPSTSREKEIPRRRDEFAVEENERDPGAYTDLQEFLTACGFPWIEAPGEAEAQCVELERLGLSQPNFVEIAMLSGGDYSQGIQRVGIVTAIELLTEFSPNRLVGEEIKETNTTMSRIEEWIFSKNKAEPSPIRRKIKTLIEKNNLIEDLRGISNPDIVDAYLRPNVDSSREPLRWKKVDVDKLRNLAEDKLGWDGNKFDKIALPSFQKWNDFITGKSSYQKHITSYALAQSADEQKVEMTKRVAEALARLSKKINPEPLSLICQATFEDNESVPSQRTTKRKEPANKGRGGKRVPKRAPLPQMVLSESSDSDF